MHICLCHKQESIEPFNSVVSFKCMFLDNQEDTGMGPISAKYPFSRPHSQMCDFEIENANFAMDHLRSICNSYTEQKIQLEMFYSRI